MVFICKNLSPLHPKDAQIGPEVLEKKIFIFRKCIFTISLLSPSAILGKEHGLSFV